MTRKPPNTPLGSARITSPFTGQDAVEYSRMELDLINTLQSEGEYKPAVDDIHIDQIARNVIHSKNIDRFLHMKTATENTYSKVADSKAKFSKIIDNAIHKLAISRRDRLSTQTQTNLISQLKETMLKGLNDAGESTS